MRYLFVALCVPLLVWGQKPTFPQVSDGYFTPPIGHNIRLSGNFGELRDNHFHAGLDFKSSRGRAGDDIMAVADGFIQRIKIERGGYGKTLYIEHPCGLTSVYAHLSGLESEYEAYVDSIQRVNENFEVTIYPDSNEFKVARGQVIGAMGNSGHSYGPHLHFELRDTRTDIPVNPMHYGFGITDDKAPEVRALFLYILDHRHNVISRKAIPIYFSDDRWRPTSGSVQVNGWRCALGVDAIDRQNGSSNKNGIYRLTTTLNDSLIYAFATTHCSFAETRQMNAHIDYGRRQTHNQFVHRAHVLPNNTLSMYDDSGQGVIPVFKNQTQKVILSIEDYHGNKNTIELLLDQAKTIDNQTADDVFHAYFSYDKANYFNTRYISIFSPTDGLFEDIALKFIPTTDDSGQLISLRVGLPEQPIKKNMSILIDDALINKEFKDKACLIYKEHRKKEDRSVGGKPTPTGLKATIPYLGLFEIDYDTIAPTIKLRNPKSIWESGDKVKWELKDNYEVIGDAQEVRITTYRNGSFVPAYYDLKSHTLELSVRQDWGNGDHTIKIIAIDDKENQAVWEQTLSIK